MNKIEAAIFDLDGTLLDSMHIWFDVGEKYVENKGIKPKPDMRERLKEMTLAEAAQYIRNEYKISDSAEQIIADIYKIVENFYIDTAMLKPGVLELLKSLKIKGVKMCVATASERKFAEAALKRNGVLDIFEYILTCNEVGVGKTKPDIYNTACEMLKSKKSDTWVFEDALHAAKTAKDAGFMLCGVYDKSENNCDELKELSDLYVENFIDICNVI